MSLKKCLNWMFYFTLPLLLIVSMEMMKKEGLPEVFQWILDKPSRLFVTYIFVLCIQSCLFIFTKICMSCT